MRFQNRKFFFQQAKTQIVNKLGMLLLPDQNIVSIICVVVTKHNYNQLSSDLTWAGKCAAPLPRSFYNDNLSGHESYYRHHFT